MAPEIVTGRENIGNSGDHTSERPQAPPPPKVERRDNGLHHGPKHMREVAAEHKAQREQKAEREIAALQGRLEKISENRPPAPPRPSSPSKIHRLSYQNETVTAEKPRQPLVEVMPANTNTITHPRKTGFLSSMGEKLRGFAGVVGLVTLLGGDKPASGETPHSTTPTTDTRPSTATPTAENTPDTKVDAHFSPANTSPESPSTPEDEGPADITGEYELKKGEGFYIGAKKALRDALAKPGVDESIVYAQIVEEYGLDSALLNDPKKLQEIWAIKQGEREVYGIHPNKGGGYRYKITLDPDAKFRVYLQDYRSLSAPVVEVIDGMSTHEERIHETFSVGPENAKKTFHIGQEVTYETKSGKKGTYTIQGPSQDTKLGLILRELGTNKEFAISGSEDTLARVNKTISEEEAPYRLVTPPGQSGEKPNETPVNGVDLNPTPAEPPAPKDESGLKDMGRLDPINSDFSTHVPKSETRVRKEPNSVEEALLGNGTVPENDPARARAMIAWNELDLTLSQSFLGYPDSYEDAKKRSAKLIEQLLKKGGEAAFVDTANVLEEVNRRITTVTSVREETKKQTGLFRRLFRTSIQDELNQNNVYLAQRYGEIVGDALERVTPVTPNGEMNVADGTK